MDNIKNIKRLKKIFLILACLLISICTNQIEHVMLFPNEGLDYSWGFANNYFFVNNINYGKDVIFTYGPLGWIVGATLETMRITFVIWLLLTLLLASTIFYNINHIINKKTLSTNTKILIYLASLIFVFLFCSSYLSAEYYIIFIYLNLMLIYLFQQIKKTFIFGAMTTLLTISIFIKFSMAIEMYGFAIIFLLISFVNKNSSRKELFLHVTTSILTFIIIYLAYSNCSFVALYKYIYGSLQISMGYNWGMSISTFVDYELYLSLAIIIIMMYTILLIAQVRNKNNLILLLPFVPIIFFTFKHGFVRGDGHVMIFFTNTILINSILFVYFDFNVEQKLKTSKEIFRLSTAKLIFFTVFLISIFSVAYNPTNIIEISDNLKSKFRPFYKQSIKLYEEIDLYSRQYNKFSDNFLKIIGKDTVSIYPINIWYAKNHNLNFVPLYVFQAYSGYTPWLDQQSAAKYNDINKPEYIILDSKVIDNRFAFIEMPMTWTSIINNYYIFFIENDTYLLKKREQPRYNKEDFKLLSTLKIRNHNEIKIENENHYIKIKAQYSLLGKISNIIYKTPAINMKVNYRNGKHITKRVILQNLSNGFLLSSIPVMNSEIEEQIIELFNSNNSISNEIKSISFSGEGLEYFSDYFDVELYKIVKSN